MKQLLDGALAPITNGFGFFRIPIDELSTWLFTRQVKFGKELGIEVSQTRISGSLGTLLKALLPLISNRRRRYLLIPTRSAWTALLDNGWQGTDTTTLDYTARELNCQAVRFVCAPDVKVTGWYGSYGARIFELYGPQRPGDADNCIRAVSVANDGGRWRMDTMGDPLPGEDASWLEPRRVKDRFQEEHLATLLKSVGIDAFNEDFYLPEAILLELHGPAAPGAREYQLDELQALARGVSDGSNN